MSLERGNALSALCYRRPRSLLLGFELRELAHAHFLLQRRIYNSLVLAETGQFFLGTLQGLAIFLGLLVEEFILAWSTMHGQVLFQIQSGQRVQHFGGQLWVSCFVRDANQVCQFDRLDGQRFFQLDHSVRDFLLVVLLRFAPQRAAVERLKITGNHHPAEQVLGSDQLRFRLQFFLAHFRPPLHGSVAFRRHDLLSSLMPDQNFHLGFIFPR